MRKKIRMITAVLMMLCMLIAPFGQVMASAATGEVKDKLEVHYIDVGQGDAALIKCGTHAMLIDAGDNSCGTKVQNYLKKQKVKKLDYFVITHTDSDHSGGADVILTKFDCGKVIYPDVKCTTATWRDVESAMKYKRYKRTEPKVGATYSLGDAKFTILSPSSTKNVSSNDSSVALRLVHGKNSFLFAGDAEEAAQNTMIKGKKTLKSTVYKVSHHGSVNGTSERFLSAVKPTYAVISCGEDNSYGHPHAGILTMLRKAKIKVYRTDEQGSIMARSDGKKVTFNCSPSESWQSGDGKASDSQNRDAGTDNTDSSNDSSSKVWLSATGTKYHKVNDCGTMNPKTARQVSQKDAISKGYDKCRRCWE